MENEYLLQEKLHNLNIPFLNEDQMRKKGYPKTPDIKLEIPVIIQDHVVNWIDSKASFGDEYSHRVNSRDQFWGYKNRYGPGMVIYWFGFIDELQHQDQDILICDDLPNNIVKLNLPNIE